MKWIAFIIILGIAEIATIGQLHTALGTSKLIVLYIVTTAIGAFFLYLKMPQFKAAVKAGKRLDKKFKKQAQRQDYQPTAKDIEKVRPFMFIALYLPALILIAIPGIISDVVGILMVFPVLSDWLLQRSVDKYATKINRNNAERD